MKKKVLLGMSGGVDSSVSAILLKNQGYEVIGCTMKLWNSEKDEFTRKKEIDDVKKICKELGIEHFVFDYEKEFKSCVVDNFICEYENARTPNPCVECNRYFKFGELLKKAKELGCDFLATGHYARIIFSERYHMYVLKRSEEIKKDQTYFLYSIPKEELEHILFPLQNYENKQEIRDIAKEYGLKVSEKKDSQEICFIPNNDYQSFLNRYMDNECQKGDIVLKNGEILGKHDGLINYTIGQRKGLGIAYKEPLYVIKLDKQKNIVIVGTEKELYSNVLYAKNLNWLLFDKLDKEIECYAKIRYRANPAKARVYKEEERVKVIFDEPQRAITPGQSVVFYDEEGVVIGGGIIE